MVMEGQDELIIRKSNSEKVGLEDDNQAVLDDIGYNNADLYIYIHTIISFYYSIENRSTILP